MKSGLLKVLLKHYQYNSWNLISMEIRTQPVGAKLGTLLGPDIENTCKMKVGK